MSIEPHATTLYTALLAAQREFNPVVKNKQNPHLKNFYADLGAVLEAVTEPLANHGLLIVQRFGHDQGGPILITEIVHAESGQSICSELPIVSKDPTDPQKLGGAITYARRYSLLAILSLTAEDDDGNAASKPAPPGQQQRDTNIPVAGGFVVTPDGQPRPAPASTGTPAPAANGTAPAPKLVGWNEVWLEAKARGIPDRPALDKAILPEVVDQNALWKVVARLKELPKVPAGHAG